jgi:hypothetical protein
MEKQSIEDTKFASQLIDERIEELGDWRGEMLTKVRNLILQIDSEIKEEWKWRGTPVWSLEGMICTGETYKSSVKLTFAKVAFLPDPTSMFNSSLEGNVRRAIDFHESDEINIEALKELVQAAITLNKSSHKKSKK